MTDEGNLDWEGDGALLPEDGASALLVLENALSNYSESSVDATPEAEERRRIARSLLARVLEVRKAYKRKCLDHFRTMVFGRSIRAGTLDETMRQTDKLHKERQDNG